MHLSYTILKSEQVICQKLPILTYPSAFGTTSGVTPFEFRRDLWRQKTRIHGLLCCIACMILRLAILIQYWCVTDWWTDKQMTAIYRARIASRSNKNNSNDSLPEPGATEDDLCLQLPRTTGGVVAGIRWSSAKCMACNCRLSALPCCYIQ